MTMIRSLVGFARRQLHTIVSREIIKPSSPTPSHLKTYNLTVMDQIFWNTFMPVVTFYPNTNIYRSSHDKTLDLKNSLSRVLTKYYPFAGRLAKVAPSYVDCNDNGAEFLEASIDSTLSDFLQNSRREDLDQFFPHGQVWNRSNHKDDDVQSDKVTPLAVQVNHFECGGVAIAVSMFHKLADGASLAYFISDWARMTRFCSNEQKGELPVDPVFISFEYTNMNYYGLPLEESNDSVTRSFMFPNSKINELKLKVKAMTAESGQPITNPTRVEVLSWLLYKCAVQAAIKKNSGSFKPTGLAQPVNIRGKLMEPLPEKSIGNYVMAISIVTENESDMTPESFISELKKKKIQYQGFRNMETILGIHSGASLDDVQKIFDDNIYMCTSMCGYPAYDIDFGWGKPVKTTFAGNIRKNTFILMDAPNNDGIEALVCLGKQEMAIIQSDHELLAFC